MKNSILLFTLLFLSTTSAFSYTYLSYRDPQGWQSGTGSIDSATLTIKPKGAYLEYGLYLNFSTKPSSYNVQDTFEVTLYFDLPENAIVHDSWLWVGPYISRAQLLDRTRANLIYESIVQRRQDPSILYKNSSTQYELRVFPMAGNEQRKVKITYLVPVSWNSLGVSAALPVNILSASQIKPKLHLQCYETTDFQNPSVAEIPGLNFQTNAAGYKSAEINATHYTSGNLLTYNLSASLLNGMYASYFPSSVTEGYYQLALRPGHFCQAWAVKSADAFDYEPGMSTYTPNDILSQARSLSAGYLSPNDSFNLMFSQLNIAAASPDWLPADSQHLATVFGAAQASNPISSYTNIPSLLSTAISFIQSHGGDGRLFCSAILIINLPQTANQLITDLVNAMGSHIIPVRIIEYTNSGYGNYWLNNQYYWGNQYFNENFSAMTSGDYERILNAYYYPYSDPRPLADAAREVFERVQGQIQNFDAHVSLSNGFCYAKFSNSQSTSISLNGTYTVVGKYYGTPVFDVELTGMYNGVPFQQVVSVSNALQDDSIVRKMWAGAFVEHHERNNPNPDNQTKYMIRDTSLQARVLSQYTAFLALEYADTSLYCIDYENNPNGGGGGTVGLADLENKVSINAFPNPFEGSISIAIKLKSAEENLTLKIYNMNGQLVYEVPVDNAAESTIVWNGQDNEGQDVPSGIYIAELKTSTHKQVLKLVKR
ncbi:MAG: T9SS type A sorting domain-containing protein [Bacteroidetes bacterium]|nr:T9SS type A sorting domain-containing protein [Bacteroidota bacterium]